MSDFHRKVVLITGAASGFGKLLSERLSAMGARLVLGDIDHQGLSSLAQQLPGECTTAACDVADERVVKALCDMAVEHYSRLDIAINNAGISLPMKSLLETTEEDLDRNFAVNAKGVFFGMKHQIPHMLEQGEGCILNVASMAGLNGAPKLTAYVAAKHAVVGMTKTAALEFAARNIRINAVCPFFSPTPMVARDVGEDMMDFVAQGSPIKRLGTPEEMVNAMLHIIAPDNSYLVGQAIAVDGGVSAL